MLDKLRKEAGKLGANALILGVTEETSGIDKLWNWHSTGLPFGGTRSREATAVYIDEVTVEEIMVVVNRNMVDLALCPQGGKVYLEDGKVHYRSNCTYPW